MTPSSDATAQPSLPERSTSTSSGPRSWPRTRKPPPSSCSNSPAASAARTAPSSLPSLRAEHGKVRLHVQLGRLDVAELDLLHAQLLASSSACAAASGAPSTTSRAQGLAELQLRRRARLMSERDDPAHLADLGEQRVVRGTGLAASPRGRRTREGPRAAPRTRFCQRCSARNGITGEITRSPARARTRARAARPRRRPRSGAASGGCTSSRGRRRTSSNARITSTVRYAS